MDKHGVTRAILAQRFDARADSYDASAVHQWQATVAAGAADVGGDDRVLDVGTGTGLMLRRLPTTPRGGLRVGVDVSSGLLRVARREMPDATFVIADAQRLPFIDRCFDIVTCVATLPYLDADQALAEWRRVLRPGGRLVISVPADGGMTMFALLQAAARTVGIAIDDPNVGLGSHGALERIGLIHGFELEQVTDARFDEPLNGEPVEIFDHYLDQGFADPLRRAPAATRQRVLAAYRISFTEAAAAHLGSHRILFASWTRT